MTCCGGIELHKKGLDQINRYVVIARPPYIGVLRSSSLFLSFFFSLSDIRIRIMDTVHNGIGWYA